MQLRLRELRKSHNYLQSKLAEELHCTQQTYSRYETGSLQPSLKILENLSVIYNTSVDYILGITDEQKPYPRKKK